MPDIEQTQKKHDKHLKINKLSCNLVGYRWLMLLFVKSERVIDVLNSLTPQANQYDQENE
jgi:hypothetical protein